MENRRSYRCPKCGYHLLAREGDKVICLSYSCNWETEARRKEDYEIPDIQNIKREYNG